MAIYFIVGREAPYEPDILTPVAHLTLTVLDAAYSGERDQSFRGS